MRRHTGALFLSLVAALFLCGFQGCETEEMLLGGMHFYYGNLHSHTACSDGEGTPAEALTFARDTAKYDFYAITDHADFLMPWQWDEIGAQVDAFTVNGAFVALRGFEWGSPLFGHINVFNTNDFKGCVVMPGLDQLYQWIDAQGGIGKFNHPGNQPLNFNDLKVNAEVQDNMVGLETGNGGDGNIDGTYFGQYIQALDNGWRVAPEANQDNHKLKTNTHRTVLIAPTLKRAALLDALKQRRTFSSDDPNMHLIFKAGGHWMGSEVQISGNAVELTAYASDDEPLEKLEIITNGGALVAAKTVTDGGKKVLWKVTVPVTGDAYYFLKVTASNPLDPGEGQAQQIALSAPIWVKRAQ